MNLIGNKLIYYNKFLNNQKIEYIIYYPTNNTFYGVWHKKRQFNYQFS